MRSAALLMLGVLTGSFQTPGAARLLAVGLPDAITPDTCLVHTFLRGEFGGFGGPPETRVIDAHTLGIPTTNFEGRPARSLKAVIWCKDHAVALLDIPALEQSGYRASVAPSRLKSLPITGRVLPIEGGPPLGGLDLRVFFQAGWMCNFFDLVDCMVPAFDMATRRLGADGSFSFTVPDIAGDPAIEKFHASRDGFRLDLLEPVAPYRRYGIDSAGWLLPIAASYSTSLLLKPVPIR
jgi:hypothetical protein